MAPFLSFRALIRSPATAASPSVALLPSLSATRLLGARLRSDSPADVHVVEIDLEAEGSSSGSGSAEMEALRRRRIVDDAIHGIVIRQFAPDWLPFAPGASYWIPRQRRPYRVTQLIASLADSKIADPKLKNSLSMEEKMSFTSERGWPSSAYFFEGPSPRQVKTPRKVPKTKSDDEDS
ncbi:hypothetical protein Cni_G14237 [Canna indica]|uniref:Uncharacterized protein n=1 Tax=Canna indica TaxID=4628 RepID=A0AAQ3KB22_9LILI|nr:hypothetical protein Cni_G14237 [Canna indica]